MKYSVVCSWLVALCASITTQCWSADSEPVWTYDGSQPLATCPAGPDACALWMQFRKAHPWPYQAISTATRGPETIVILSETPPPLGRADISALVRATFGDDNVVQISRLRWATGLDGWLEDAVVRLRYAETAPSMVAERLPAIAQALFGTADGFRAVNLNDTTAAPERCRIEEIAVGPAELSHWLAESTDWRSLDTGSLMPAADLRSGTHSGAFVREDGLLVAFVIKKNANLAEFRAAFRRFAVASDIVLGASAPKGGHFILYARRRSAGQDCLPPLRFETFELFARTARKQLAQSYERQRIFAGKVREGVFKGWDWAPIYLSGELDDSEFGTLLNLADQELKSWSEHGKISYFAFDYPAPETFPFADQSASEYFTGRFGTDSLVFNWNTSGLGLITSFPSSDQLLTVDRTGALPILYIPSGGLVDLFAKRLDRGSANSSDMDRMQNDIRNAISKEAEKQANAARGYFATLGDPILTRVVQNVTLYQATRAFIPVSTTTKLKISSRSDLTVKTMRDEAARWIADVSTGKNSRGLSPKTIAAIKEFLRTSKMTPAQMAEIIATPEAAVQRFASVEGRRRDLYASFAEEAPQADKAVRIAQDAFQKFCDGVGGTITTVSKGKKCEYRESESGNSESKKAAVNRLQMIALRLNDSVESLYQNLQAADDEIRRLVETFEAARKLGETLQEEAQFVSTLGTVLQNVQKAASAVPTSGTIRTPALVMSRNVEDSTAIGGHNIDSTATHVRVVAETGQAAHFEGTVGQRVLIVPAKQLGDAPALAKRLDEMPAIPERAAREALKVGDSQPETLLEAFRTTPAHIEEGRVQEMLEAAGNCDCDVLVRQDGDVFRIVRNESSPKVIEVPARTGVIDAIAGPPPGNVVRFEGVDPVSVEYFAQSVALARAEAGGGGINDFIRSVRGVFSGKPGGAGDPLLVAWGKRRNEVIRIVDEKGNVGRGLTESGAAAGKSVWKFSGDKDELAAAAGLSTPRPTSVGQAAIVVRFRGNGTAVLDPVGIYAELDGKSGAAAQLALEQVAAAQVARDALNHVNLSERVAELADTLRSRLTPSELHFFRASKFTGTQITQVVDLQH